MTISGDHPADAGLREAICIDVMPEFLSGAQAAVERHGRQQREFWSKALLAGSQGLVFVTAVQDNLFTARVQVPVGGSGANTAAELQSWARLLPDGYKIAPTPAPSPGTRPRLGTRFVVRVVRRIHLVDLPPDRPWARGIAQSRMAAKARPDRRRSLSDRPRMGTPLPSVPAVARLCRASITIRIEPDRWLRLMSDLPWAFIEMRTRSVDDDRRTLDARVYEALLGRDPLAPPEPTRPDASDPAPKLASHAAPLMSRRPMLGATLFSRRADFRRLQRTHDLLSRPSDELRSVEIRVVAPDPHSARDLALAWAEAHGGAGAFWISPAASEDDADGGPPLGSGRGEPLGDTIADLPDQLRDRREGLGLLEGPGLNRDEIRRMARDMETLFTEGECRRLFRLPIGPVEKMQSVPISPFVDVVPSAPWVAAKGRVHIGRLGAAERPGAEATWHAVPCNDMPKHAIVAGVPGSGKSTTVVHLVEEIHQLGLPFLVIEPVKTEYIDRLGSRVPGLVRRRFEGDADGRPAADYLRFDPVRLPPRVTVERHVASLKSCFEAAFPLEDVLSLVLVNGLRAYFTRPVHEGGCSLGPFTRGHATQARLRPAEDGRPPRIHPSFEDFISFFLELYLPEATDPRGLGGWAGETAYTWRQIFRRRFENLWLGPIGVSCRLADDAYRAVASRAQAEGKEPEDVLPELEAAYDHFPALLAGPTVVELDGLVDNEQKALMMAFLLSRLIGQRQAEDRDWRTDFRRRGLPVPDSQEMKHMLILEEAHRVLSGEGAGSGRPGTAAEGPRARAVTLFCEMFAESRAYGQALTIVEQSPSKLAPDAIRNTNLKVAMRLTAAEDRDLLGLAMTLTDDQRAYLPRLRPGDFVAYHEKLDRPALLTLRRDALSRKRGPWA